MSDGGAQFKHLYLGSLFPGFTIEFFEAGSFSSTKNVWIDETKSSPVNTIVADSRGMAIWYGDGDYNLWIKDTDGNDLYKWPSVKITSDTATMWEGNFGTSFPSAAAKNRWQLFAKVTAGNELTFLGINNGSAFRTIAQPIGKGADVASTSELPVISDGNYFDVTGTAGITSIASLGIGTTIKLHFDDAVTITHDATDLILPDGNNITTQAGTELTFIEYASGDWRMIGGGGGVLNPLASNWPSFSVYLSANQTNITAADQVEFDTEDFDTNSNFNTTTFEFIPTVKGKYLFIVNLHWNSTISGDKLQIHLYKNGALFKLAANTTSATAGGTSGSFIVDANGIDDDFKILAANIERDTSSIASGITNTTWAGSRIA